MQAVLLTWIFSAVSLGGPNLGDIWYRETMLGDLGGALQEYQRLYKDSEAPMDLRKRAAFQAGLCAEKQGNFQRAQQAYEWLSVNGAPEELIIQKARLRMRKLEPLLNLPSQPSREDLSPILKKLTAQVNDGMERRRRALQAASAETDKQLAAQATAARISRWLRGAGVELDWRRDLDALLDAEPAASVPMPRMPPLETFIEKLGLEPRDDAFLRQRLSSRLFLLGLKAMRDLDLKRAKKCLQMRLVLEPGDGESEEFLGAVDNFLSLIEGLQEIARHRLGEEVERQLVDADFQTAMTLRQANGQFASSEIEKTAQLFLTVKRHEDWAPAGMRLGGSLRQYSKEAIERLEAIFQQPLPAEFEKHSIEGARIADSLASQAEDLLVEWPAPWEEGAPRLAFPDLMRPGLKAEIEKTITYLEERMKPGDPQKSDATKLKNDPGTTQWMEDVLTVLEWFPDLDPSQRHKRWLESSLKR